MMNNLLKTMSNDMGILRYHNESDKSYIYRICYSALGLWCLNTAKNSTDGIIGTTKHNQTIVLNDLLARFTELIPYISDKFCDESNSQKSFSVSVRRIYEETGYLITDINNYNQIANFGRTIQMNDESLFFGLPITKFKVNGLGVFTNCNYYNVDLYDFLIRDNLMNETYLKTRFNPIDFYERDLNLTELEYFNPTSVNVPSMSWSKKIETDCTVARKMALGPYYRIMKIDSNYFFADEPVEQQTDSFTSYEYRRLYFALKAHYRIPVKAIVTKLDESYSKIRLGGQLPNREYYLMLLLAWPEHNAFDKVCFIIRNDLLSRATDVLINIGIEIKGGQLYE